MGVRSSIITPKEPLPNPHDPGCLTCHHLSVRSIASQLRAPSPELCSVGWIRDTCSILLSGDASVKSSHGLKLERYSWFNAAVPQLLSFVCGPAPPFPAPLNSQPLNKSPKAYMICQTDGCHAVSSATEDLDYYHPLQENDSGRGLCLCSHLEAQKNSWRSILCSGLKLC